MTCRRRLLLGCIVAVMILSPAVSVEAIRFAVLGDSRGTSEQDAVNEQVFCQIVDQILQVDPPVQFVVFAGDLVKGTDNNTLMAEHFRIWHEAAAPWYASDMIGAKVYAVPGNHDLQNVFGYAGLWQDAFPDLPDNGPAGDKKLSYSFDAGPCHVVSVNTDAPLRGNRVYDMDWLADDLAASDAPIKLVVGHQPAFPCDGHIGSSLDKYPTSRDEFWQILVDNGVKAYFCGHEHLYDHWIKDGVHQIITGGAGAPGLFFHYLILDADEQDVTVSVYRLSGELYEQYKLSQTEGVPNEPRINTDPSVLDKLPCTLPFGCIVSLCIAGCVGLSHCCDSSRDRMR